MSFFAPENRNKSQRHARIYAAFELVHTCVDLVAAACFLTGSLLFLHDSLKTVAIWFFIAGSLAFALKPALRFARELKFLAMGDLDTLADRAPK